MGRSHECERNRGERYLETMVSCPTTAKTARTDQEANRARYLDLIGPLVRGLDGATTRLQPWPRRESNVSALVFGEIRSLSTALLSDRRGNPPGFSSRRKGLLPIAGPAARWQIAPPRKPILSQTRPDRRPLGNPHAEPSAPEAYSISTTAAGPGRGRREGGAHPSVHAAWVWRVAEGGDVPARATAKEESP